MVACKDWSWHCGYCHHHREGAAFAAILQVPSIVVAVPSCHTNHAAVVVAVPAARVTHHNRMLQQVQQVQQDSFEKQRC